MRDAISDNNSKRGGESATIGQTADPKRLTGLATARGI